MEYTLSTFPGGTDHTRRHTNTVEKIARMMLSDEFLASLSDEEIYFLTLACHYHDLAMAGTASDDISSTARDQVRSDHALRIGQIIAAKWDVLGFESSREAEVLGEICRGHRPMRNAEGVANWEELSANEVLAPGISVRTRLMSALVYAADEMHIGSDRAPERIQSWRAIEDNEAKRHWCRHQSIFGPTPTSSNELLFQAQAATPEFQENLRSHVFQKALAAVTALRAQATAEGVRAKLPDVIIEWNLKEIWELLLPLSCADMKPRSAEEIAQKILRRYQESVRLSSDLGEFCREIGKIESELLSQINRCVADAVLMGHLQKDPDHDALLLLSANPAHASAFFSRTIKADELDLLYVGRYQETWEQELFGSGFGRVYVRKTVIPAVEIGYSVQLSQRPPSDPTRVLLEQCPTAARIARDYCPLPNNLVKTFLLNQVVTTGALIDFHSNPDRLLDERVRASVKALVGPNLSATGEIRLLEELALVGGLSHEQITSAMIPSAAHREFMENAGPQSSEPVHFTITQSVPIRAEGKTHLPYLLFAGHRAGTPIFLAPSEEFKLRGSAEGDNKLAAAANGPFTLGVGPSSSAFGGPLKMPARLVVNEATRTIRLHVGAFSCGAPTAYPIAVTLPIPSGTPEIKGTASMLIQIPELTLGDLRAIEAANALAEQGNTRIEFFADSTWQIFATSKPFDARKIFDLQYLEEILGTGFNGLDDRFLAPTLVPVETIREINRLPSDERAARWEAERSTAVVESRKAASLYLRLTTADGRCCDERFIRYLPFDVFSPPFERDENLAEAFDKWTDGTGDFLFTAYFAADVHELASALVKWCADLGEFPFKFRDASPGPTTRSVLTMRVLARRDRTWHFDRPIIFEFRPVMRSEAYQMEADYWRSVGDDRRAGLAEELREAKDLSPEFRNWIGAKGNAEEGCATLQS
ncbi:MAG TPA: hypothetical protein VFE47_26105 [Tepidisphaeraceae bacterium]|nr:hypothetical protein [Tepidisphaeraceae bacterium]